MKFNIKEYELFKPILIALARKKYPKANWWNDLPNLTGYRTGKCYICDQLFDGHNNDHLEFHIEENRHLLNFI